MNLGIGVMLFCNAETVEAYTSSVNKKIKNAVLSDNELTISFEDNTNLRFYDDGQSCCETRYMVTDDNLSDLIGHTFIGAELKEAPSIEDEYGDHEVQFLEIRTDVNSVVLSNHNEHNGYYGGFAIICRK